MPAGLTHQGPLANTFLVTPGMTGVVAVDQDADRMWVYEATEVYVPEEGEDREFRGYRFVCRNEEGEDVQDMPDYQLRLITQGEA